MASHWDGWADALKGWIKDGKGQSTEAGAALSQAGGNYPQQGNVEGNMCLCNRRYMLTNVLKGANCPEDHGLHLCMDA